jgi:hypothetical protein
MAKRSPDPEIQILLARGERLRQAAAAASARADEATAEAV